MSLESGRLCAYSQVHGQDIDTGVNHSMNAVSDLDSNCWKHEGLDGSLGLSQSLSLAVIQ